MTDDLLAVLAQGDAEVKERRTETLHTSASVFDLTRHLASLLHPVPTFVKGEGVDGFIRGYFGKDQHGHLGGAVLRGALAEFQLDWLPGGNIEQKITLAGTLLNNLRGARCTSVSDYVLQVDEFAYAMPLRMEHVLAARLIRDRCDGVLGRLSQVSSRKELGHVLALGAMTRQRPELLPVFGSTSMSLQDSLQCGMVSYAFREVRPVVPMYRVKSRATHLAQRLQKEGARLSSSMYDEILANVGRSLMDELSVACDFPKVNDARGYTVFLQNLVATVRRGWYVDMHHADQFESGRSAIVRHMSRDRALPRIGTIGTYDRGGFTAENGTSYQVHPSEVARLSKPVSGKSSFFVGSEVEIHHPSGKYAMFPNHTWGVVMSMSEKVELQITHRRGQKINVPMEYVRLRTSPSLFQNGWSKRRIKHKVKDIVEGLQQVDPRLHARVAQRYQQLFENLGISSGVASYVVRRYVPQQSCDRLPPSCVTLLDEVKDDGFLGLVVRTRFELSLVGYTHDAIVSCFKETKCYSKLQDANVI